MLVLGQTPKFHSTRPSAPGAYGRGASAMPRKAAWMRYVKAVARRNAAVWGNSVRLQVWNEGNAPPYWSGTPRQMAVLTAWTRAALRSAGSSAQLIGPAMVTRLTSQQTYLRKFYDQRVNGKNVSRYVDALSFQLYPSATGAPESSMTLLRRVRLILARRSISKPIYNTEINYGLVGGPQAGAGAKKISTSRAGRQRHPHVRPQRAEPGPRRVLVLLGPPEDVQHADGAGGRCHADGCGPRLRPQPGVAGRFPAGGLLGGQERRLLVRLQNRRPRRGGSCGIRRSRCRSRRLPGPRRTPLVGARPARRRVAPG